MADLVLKNLCIVDGSGALVGEPIVGANVPAYKQFVEDYLNAQ